MSKEISISVNIADVSYPLRVALEDEPLVRQAARMINDKVRKLRDDYQISDKVTLLSMCAMQLANELVALKEKQGATLEGLSSQLQSLETILDGAIARL